MIIDIQDIRAAAERLEGVAHRTPVITSRTLDALAGARLHLKCENLQRGGAFKFRGAYNRLSSLPPDVLARGVAAFSSGNHAQAVALASRELGTKAVILMPRDAPAQKLEATLGYGAEVVTFDRYTEDRVALASALAKDRGMTQVPPYDEPFVMAGQGTVALELLEQAPPLDLLMVPIGGGGLISGSATVMAALSPGTRVVGVEPEAGDDTRRSLAAGERVRIEIPRTIADGLQVDSPGELTFEVTRRLVDAVVVVSDAEIVAAMRILFERTKQVVEPSGAVGVAAVLNGRVDVAGAEVGVVLSGGNVSAAQFAELMGPE